MAELFPLHPLTARKEAMLLSRGPPPVFRTMSSMSKFGLSIVLALLVTSCAATPVNTASTTPGKSDANAAEVVSPTVTDAPDHSQAKIPVLRSDITFGAANAKVTVVAFVDYQCPFCERVRSTLNELVTRYGDDLRLVIKNNPLPFHERAYEAALAATTVRALAGNSAAEKFFDKVLSQQKALSSENLESWANEVGLASVVYREAMEIRRFSERVDADIELAKRLGITGTPAFRINGLSLDGSQPIERFVAIVEAQINAANALLAANVRPSDIYVKLTEKNVEIENAQATERATQVKEQFDKTVWKVPISSDDPQLGVADALVTITVFSDFECPFCARVEDTLREIREKYGNDVRFIWKDNPLPFHKSAKKAAILGRLVYLKRGSQEFWKIHDGLFAHQESLEEYIAEQAKGYGITERQLINASSQGNAARKIEQSQELADSIAVRGTPHFFINGVRLSGAQPKEVFVERIEFALAVAKAQIGAGVQPQKLYDTLIKIGKSVDDFEVKSIATAPGTRPTRGPNNAKVTLQLFSDFQCPFCKRLEPTIEELVKEFPTELKIVWRHLPLPFHEHAMLAAEASEAVFAQKGSKGFWQFHDGVFSNQEQDDGLSRENLERIAQGIGVDMTRFRSELDEGTYRKIVESDVEVSKAADISGTPASVINGYFVSGAQPTAYFRRAIRRALRDMAAAKNK
jgi:protein-disulfide isomerase